MRFGMEVGKIGDNVLMLGYGGPTVLGGGHSKMSREMAQQFSISPLGAYSSHTPYPYEASIHLPKEDDQRNIQLPEGFTEKTKAVVSEVSKEEFSLIYAHDWLTFDVALELQEQHRKPMVLHIHSLEYDRAGGLAMGWRYELERRAMEKADHIIVVSAYTLEVVKKHYPTVDVSKISVVHNGLAPFKTFRKEKPFPEKLIGFVGRLALQKGAGLFLEVAEKLLQKRNDLRFVMAGDGPMFDALVELTAVRGLSGKVHFTGHLEWEKLSELYAMMDVLCMPSFSEPFGLVGLEGARFGVPVVLSENSGVKEVLTSASCASYPNVEEFVDQILNQLDTTWGQRYATVRQQRQAENCTQEKATQQIAQILEKVGGFLLPLSSLTKEKQ